MTTEISKEILKAASLLKHGEVVAIPTETVYGLAANAFNAIAVTKIFEVKDRPFFDPLIIHTSSANKLSEYAAEVPDWAVSLFNHFSPGPITIVLKKKSIIPDIVTAGLDTVGIRIPDHPLTLELLRQLDFPLAAPSANPFGYVSPTTVEHVSDLLSGKIPYILDGGDCTVGVESTIVGEVEGKITILRLGGISVERIEAIVGPVAIQTSSSKPASPGMLESHYAPKKKVVLKTPEFPDTTAGYIRHTTYIDGVPKEHQRVLSSSGDMNEAARNVFAALRDLDKTSVKMIYAELLPEMGLGRAINDRLRRAAH